MKKILLLIPKALVILVGGYICFTYVVHPLLHPFVCQRKQQGRLQTNVKKIIEQNAQAFTVERVMSSTECSDLGGEIVNTLEERKCSEENILGKVEGMRCPCICCKGSKVAKLKIYTVERVIDGDTIVVRNSEGKSEEVQLMGIDAPESKPNDKAKRDSERTGQDMEDIIKMGKRATDNLKGFIGVGTKCYLEFDVQQRDKYGRLLAYIYHIDEGASYEPDSLSHVYRKSQEPHKGEMFLNASMIKQGYATPMTILPNVKYADLFQELYQEARENKRGLWNKAESTAHHEYEQPLSIHEDGVLIMEVDGFQGEPQHIPEHQRDAWEQNTPSEPIACTMDVKECPDGSYVGRVPPQCEFKACPSEKRGSHN